MKLAKGRGEKKKTAKRMRGKKVRGEKICESGQPPKANLIILTHSLLIARSLPQVCSK
jgi:hypothetical protein